MPKLFAIRKYHGGQPSSFVHGPHGRQTFTNKRKAEREAKRLKALQQHALHRDYRVELVAAGARNA